MGPEFTIDPEQDPYGNDPDVKASNLYKGRTDVSPGEAFANAAELLEEHPGVVVPNTPPKPESWRPGEEYRKPAEEGLAEARRALAEAEQLRQERAQGDAA